MIEKIFIKEWPDQSRLQVSFTTVGGPIIIEDVVENSKYSQEVKELSDGFYLKKLDNNILRFLEEKGFQEYPLFSKII